MGILRSIKNEHILFENTALECVVAIHESEVKKIKTYFKKYKGKKEKPSELVNGYLFIYDEEFESNKIDFSKVVEFEIRDLSKIK
ncbi:hypothetical protein [Saccharicrinis aurantiacus]|uniref:hypothetical protein n=1 Tax=Saccharicrinis aurantiacus TaxID=1849719 RepID=UPI00094F8243|nr:hypothetical protein [Saccharicrinis aurantiacus]